jgi:hypothetical protein
VPESATGNQKRQPTAKKALGHYHTPPVAVSHTEKNEAICAVECSVRKPAFGIKFEDMGYVMVSEASQ